MTRTALRLLVVVLALISTLAACTLVAPLEDVKDNNGRAGNGGAANGSGGKGGTTADGAADCPGVFDESKFDEGCFQ